MKDPPRLLEDSPTALERILLDAGASYRCSDATRTKTLEALGIAGGVALSASAVGVASTSWFAKIGWAKLLIGVSAIGAATAVPLSYQALQRHRTARATSSHSVAPAQANAPSPGLAGAEPVTEVRPVQVEPLAAAASVAASPVRSNGSSKGDSRVDSPVPGLAEELSALDSARGQLAKGDPFGALARLDAYTRTYPKGRLQLEAEVLRIDALTKSGQAGLAKKRAESFLRRYPNSVLATRVRALLGS